MPTLSAWTIRAALLWLAAASLLGALTLARASLGLPVLATWIPRHAEMMLFGWMVQLAFGVAHWILPRPGTILRADTGRVAVVAVVALNTGLVLVLCGATLIGRVVEGLAVLSFA